MKTVLVSILLLCGAIFVSARPQLRTSNSRGGGVPQRVECLRHEVQPGKFAFNCEGANRNQEALTLRSEHVLWINQDGSQAQEIEVLVPNYKIEELIKAGFKGGVEGGTKVNILLKKPETSYNAEVGAQDAAKAPPSVNVLYEPVEKLLIHYPNDKPYQASSGPILPPA